MHSDLKKKILYEFKSEAGPLEITFYYERHVKAISRMMQPTV